MKDEHASSKIRKNLWRVFWSSEQNEKVRHTTKNHVQMDNQ